jgi:tetratricopeptide (TPR) repeat protein
VAAANGNRDAEVAALRRAAKVNGGDLNIQESLARGLIEAGQNQEAYAQYRDMLQRWPSNTNALVNYGLLAHRLGNEGEAVDSWQRAIAVDPEQSRAQLYVAEALEQQGDLQAAARHYRIYLQLAAAHPAEHRDDARELLSVLIKVADSDAAASRADEAGKGYAEAARLAAKAKENGLESLALVRLADAKEKSGDAAEAARDFQRALILDANSTDKEGVAADWLNYAQLLRHHGQSERLVFACLLHAEELLSGNSSDERAAVVQERSESATRLGRVEAAKVLSAKSALAQEALSLSPAQLSAQP